MTKQEDVKEIIIPEKSESAAIASKVKVASLFYDRVWCPPENVFQFDEEFPVDIRFYGGTEEEQTISYNISNRSIKTLPSMKKLFESDEGLQLIKSSTLGLMALQMSSETKDDFKKVMVENNKSFEKKKENYLENTNVIMDLIYHDIAKAFSKKFQVPIVTICESCQNQKIAYSNGDRQAIMITIESIGIADENHLSWSQVLEFRKDQKNRQKYRRFLHWFDKEMIGKSKSFIEDEISIRLEDYEQSLKKYGIKTIIGTVEEALDGKYLLSTSGIAGSLTYTGHPVLGMLSAGFLIGGKIGIKLLQAKLDYEEIESGPNSEISWVYEVKKIE